MWGASALEHPSFLIFVNMNKMQDIKFNYSYNIFCKLKKRLALIKSLYIKYKMTDFSIAVVVATGYIIGISKEKFREVNYFQKVK